MRESSVDTLLDIAEKAAMPGFNPITMAQLWELAWAARNVLMAAEGHMGDSYSSVMLLDRLSRFFRNIMLYTIDLRSTHGS